MKDTTEEFIDIQGYEGQYQIGTRGTVISLEREKSGKGNSTYHMPQRALTTQTNKSGYVSLKLIDMYGVAKKIDVHRLVALNWIDNPLDKPQVNHIDGNKSNNSIENLEWNTAAENMAHASMMGLMVRGEKHWKTSLTKKQVTDIKRIVETGLFTNNEIAEKVGTNPVNISRIKNGKRWAHIK